MIEMETFRKGEIIIEEGTVGAFAYVINSGAVEVWKMVKGNKFVLSRLGAGSIFGEMSLIDDRPRSAMVTALEDTVVRVITRDRFESILERNPQSLVPLLRQVFQRLRYMDQMVTAFCANAETDGIEVKGDPLRLTAVTKEAERAMKEKDLKITKIPFQVGRSPRHESSIFDANDLNLHDSEPHRISRRHFLISFVDNQYYVIDSGSTLGTVVDDTRIGGRDEKKSVPLGKGRHRIILGDERSPYVYDLEVP